MKKSQLLKKMLLLMACGALMSVGSTALAAQDMNAPSKTPAETIKAAKLSNAWDKTFAENKNVNHHKVIFHNRYGITLVADMYTPKNMQKGDKLPAIAVAGPYGAVKEQVSGRYAP